MRNLTNFGAFVEIESGIEGLVHISDMSWTKRIRHPSEILKKGDKVDVVVLGADKDNRKISLGLKQIDENPWMKLVDTYGVGTPTKGIITKVHDRGVVVELEEEVEGFVPLSHLGQDNIARPADIFKPGDELPLRVIKIDPDSRKILLSVKEYLDGQERDEVEQYMKKYGPKRITVGDHVGAIDEGEGETPTTSEAKASEGADAAQPEAGSADEAPAAETVPEEKPEEDEGEEKPAP